jgi:hypothetical protein
MKYLIGPILLFQTSLALSGNVEFPMGPNEELTPGELCERPDRYRYPEQIAYCERDVSSEEKDQVFEAYRRIGYRLTANRRSGYKVDHYIPLCAGGSNNKENLWPQHISVGKQTDDLEDLGCQKMALGKISQANFIKLLKRAKNNLSEAGAVRAELNAL